MFKEKKEMIDTERKTHHMKINMTAMDQTKISALQ